MFSGSPEPASLQLVPPFVVLRTLLPIELVIAAYTCRLLLVNR